MRFDPTRLTLSLFFALSACTTAPDEGLDTEAALEPAPGEVANPMAPFARLIPGAWSGTSSFDTWHWGPGKHSIRGGELELFYWHPGLKQVCMLSLHADIPTVGRGVAEGTVHFEGEVAEGTFDLYQPPGRRRMGLRWSFEGPDKYRDTLLEVSGPEGLQPLNAWDRFRVPLSEMPPRTADEAIKPAEHLKAFEALLGGTWESKGDLDSDNAPHTEATFEFVPDYVYARVHAPSKGGEPTHLLDAYIYQHVGTGALRCLALSHRGAVYEGDLTVLEGSALQLDLKGYEGDQVVALVVRLDLGLDATLRHRVWSLEGAERELMHDVHHAKLEPNP